MQLGDGGGGASGIRPPCFTSLWRPPAPRDRSARHDRPSKAKTPRLQTGQGGCKGVGTCEDTSCMRGSLPARPSLAPAPAPGLGQQSWGICLASASHRFPAWDPDERCHFWGEHLKRQKGRRVTPGAPHPLPQAHLRPSALPAVPHTRLIWHFPGLEQLGWLCDTLLGRRGRGSRPTHIRADGKAAPQLAGWAEGTMPTGPSTSRSAVHLPASMCIPTGAYAQCKPSTAAGIASLSTW